MAIKTFTPTTPGYRHRMTMARPSLSPERSLLLGRARKRGGRNSAGRVTTWHRGGGAKRQYRLIDWKRDKKNMQGRVVALHYDPNRGADLALVYYADGDKRYMLAPVGLKPGSRVVSSANAPIAIGNSLPLKKIPVGMPIHNLEVVPLKGGQLVRGAGSQAMIQSKEKLNVTVLLPSKEVRLLPADAWATIGQVSNPERRSMSLGKAGRRRHLGWRPTVRGVAMHPGAHPHGGGEGRSGIGMPSPKSPWGRYTLGKKTRSPHRYSDKYLVQDRRNA